MRNNYQISLNAAVVQNRYIGRRSLLLMHQHVTSLKGAIKVMLSYPNQSTLIEPEYQKTIAEYHSAN